jgi:hypothetical protein
MYYKTTRGMAKIKRLGSGLGIRWFVITLDGSLVRKFYTKAEAVAFVKTESVEASQTAPPEVELPVAVGIRYKEHKGVWKHYPVDADGNVIEGRYKDEMPRYALPADYHTSTDNGQDKYGLITSPYERWHRQ